MFSSFLSFNIFNPEGLIIPILDGQYLQKRLQEILQII